MNFSKKSASVLLGVMALGFSNQMLASAAREISDFENKILQSVSNDIIIRSDDPNNGATNNDDSGEELSYEKLPYEKKLTYVWIIKWIQENLGFGEKLAERFFDLLILKKDFSEAAGTATKFFNIRLNFESYNFSFDKIILCGRECIKFIKKYINANEQMVDDSIFSSLNEVIKRCEDKKKESNNVHIGNYI